VFFIFGMWMFLTAMERPLRMLGIYPSSRDCGAVTRAVEEESRDVRAGVLRYLIKLVNYSCSVICKVNYQ